jgi:hypothetical protein
MKIALLLGFGQQFLKGGMEKGRRRLWQVPANTKTERSSSATHTLNPLPRTNIPPSKIPTAKAGGLQILRY